MSAIWPKPVLRERSRKHRYAYQMQTLMKTYLKLTAVTLKYLYHLINMLKVLKESVDIFKNQNYKNNLNFWK